MITELQGQELNDRASRGIVLSATEQQSLADWYKRHDEDESRVLAQGPSTASLDALRAEVASPMTQLRGATARIEAITGQNEQLRHENERLHCQLSQQSSASGA